MWSAGHDIRELPQDGTDPLAYDVPMEKLLAPLRRNSVLSISAIKRQFRILSRAASVISSESFEKINSYRAKVYNGSDYREGINSFLEKRKPVYKSKAFEFDTRN